MDAIFVFVPGLRFSIPLGVLSQPGKQKSCWSYDCTAPTWLAPFLIVVTVGGPAVGRPFYQQALVVIELFCPSSLQVMRPLSVSPAVVNMHGFDPRMDLKIPNKYPGHFNSAKRHPRSVP
ncbi:uncharacterized protein BDCG_09124 [Blastomyces dermatitidis ER-3]|uniref:Uncharacterized protein n=1 Tax=Ajellomyces dermatitidis (strain ER-3 / ATCC MYA-2586) TaxID=559297 RepID=A0ABP2EQG3_AJEDR|nr:uncharacterized protein BDCG_09124 [Blastomyces dermatitidis ER-3]EEQ85855.2 hypothetical protein BDCG_09124 [Blastomyces dermatitidis ER-3]